MVFRDPGIKKIIKILFLIVLLQVGLLVINVCAQQVLKGEKPELISSGINVFEEGNCRMCHLVNGEGRKFEGTVDVTGIGSLYKEPKLREILIKHLFEKPDIHKYEDALTKEDIEALVQYLSTLKTPSPK